MNSMTGFGRAAAPIHHFSIRVEISGVNRKQAEIAFSLPRTCSDWEQNIRPIILERVSRGRVYVSISFEPEGNNQSGDIQLDDEGMKSLVRTIQKAEAKTGIPLPLAAGDLIRLNIIHQSSIADLDSAETWTTVEPVIREAFENFLNMRSQEGLNLKEDLLDKLATLKKFKKGISDLAPSIPVKLRENMLQRLKDAGLPVNMDDDRIIREVALFADKCDISEEISRLDSHFSQFMTLCGSGQPAGRPLDFLCQEIFREFNTIGSKANDAALSHLVVAAKTELEKIREQVQNIE